MGCYSQQKVVGAPKKHQDESSQCKSRNVWTEKNEGNWHVLLFVQP